MNVQAEQTPAPPGHEGGMLGHALWYIRKSIYVIPLCWPTWSEEGQGFVCGCGHCNSSRDAGKRPLLGKDYQELRADEKQIREWWGRWPHANIGILLEPSGLLVADLDSDEAREEVCRLGIFLTRIASTGKGLHYYYKRPENCPVGRRLQQGLSGKIDVLSKGYVVAPPSLHVSGKHYTWRREQSTIEPPDWLVGILDKSLHIKKTPGEKGQVGLFPSPLEQMLSAAESSTAYGKRGREEKDVWEALGWIPAEEYQIWLHVGMALHDWDSRGVGKGRGRLLWDCWSQQGCAHKFNLIDQNKTWSSFRPGGGIQVERLFTLAEEHRENSVPVGHPIELGPTCMSSIEGGVVRDEESTGDETMAKVVLLSRDTEWRTQFVLHLADKDYNVEAFGCFEAASLHLQRYRTDVLLWDFWWEEEQQFTVQYEQLRELQIQGLSRSWVLLVKDKEVEVVREFLLEYVDDYLLRSIPDSELEYRLSLMCRVAGPLRAGPLYLERKSRKVSLDGKELCVTQSEFQLLGLLMEHSGEAVSSEALRAVLYQDEMQYNHLNIKNNLRQYMYKLRKKLEEVGRGRAWISNIHGYGYRLEITEGDQIKEKS